MSTHSGIQLILIGLLSLGGFAAVLTALLRLQPQSPRSPGTGGRGGIFVPLSGECGDGAGADDAEQRHGAVCSAHPDSGGHALRDGFRFLLGLMCVR